MANKHGAFMQSVYARGHAIIPIVYPLNRTLAVLALALASPFSAAAALSPEIQQALQRERIPLEAVTVLVQEAGTGTTRLSLNANQPMNPASVAKLLTTYAALDELGPAYTWKTPVWFAGPIKSGVLEGNLHLQGRGDPKLTLERVWLALQRIRAMGVNEIRGDIVIDQSAFVVPETSTAEFDNEPLRPYNARSQALLLNLSAVIYTFTPDAARGVAMVSAEPLLDGAQVDATVPLGNGPCGDWRGGLKAVTGDSLRMRFSGSYPQSCGERYWALAHTDARQYSARLLSTVWRSGGGKLSGTVRDGPAPADAAPTFELTSPALSDVVRDINKYSNNVMAQQVFLTLGLLRNGGTRVSPEDAREALRLWMRDRMGESLDGVVVDNGSGLSRQTRLSAALLGRVLQRAWSSAVMPELMASLPVTGLDGTLRRSRGNAATTGRAHLKTGSLRDVQALAGYVLGASGKRYVLVAMINHPNAGAARPALDALVQWTINDTR
jgi:serine-type D-Ala-D-Ala carboxypeptidase/endopeptidase (penicillin-binding protein 4)